MNVENIIIIDNEWHVKIKYIIFVYFYFATGI